MYSSIRKQNRVMLPNGKTMAFTPAVSGRDGPATGDPKEQEAIARAMARNEPLYLLQHANGTVYDVVTDEHTAVKMRELLVARTPRGVDNIKLFERKTTMLRPIL